MQQGEQVSNRSASLTLAAYHSNNLWMGTCSHRRTPGNFCFSPPTSTHHQPEDLLVYLKLLQCPFPLSSQLCRVDPKAKVLLEGQGQTFKAAERVVGLEVPVPAQCWGLLPFR